MTVVKDFAERRWVQRQQQPPRRASRIFMLTIIVLMVIGGIYAAGYLAYTLALNA